MNFIDPTGLANCTYDSTTHDLTCTSNNSSAPIPVTVKASSGDALGGPIPVGNYTIMKADVQALANGNWFLDPGIYSRIGYRLGIARGGFNLHLPGTRTHGCITAKDGDNPGPDMQFLNNLLRAENGANTLNVIK